MGAFLGAKKEVDTAETRAVHRGSAPHGLLELFA